MIKTLSIYFCALRFIHSYEMFYFSIILIDDLCVFSFLFSLFLFLSIYFGFSCVWHTNLYRPAVVSKWSEADIWSGTKWTGKNFMWSGCVSAANRLQVVIQQYGRNHWYATKWIWKTFEILISFALYASQGLCLIIILRPVWFYCQSTHTHMRTHAKWNWANAHVCVCVLLLILAYKLI